MSKILLFDADGVLILPEDMFSVVYARSHGLDPQPFEDFFKTEWKDFVTGKRDLKQHIADNPDLWHWDGTPEEFLQYWFETEDVRNDELIALIESLRDKGVPCYLATEQEKYRAEYMKKVMFKDLFDGTFITADIGHKKSAPEFFEAAYEQLKATHGELPMSDIVFFDDSQDKVDAATKVGLTAYLYTGLDQFKKDLADEGIFV